MTDQERVQKYVQEHPDADPKNNPKMSQVINSPTYVDRGMWGPLGGKNGTISQIWLQEQKALDD